jgi:phage protein D
MPANNNPSDGPVRITIRCNGTEHSALPVVSVTVEQALNRIPWATIVLRDGDMPEGKAELSDGALFVPGTPVEISAGYGDQQAALFSGIVVRHSFRIDRGNASRLVVECRHKATRLTLGRRSAVYTRKTDSAILKSLIATAGLSARITTTSVTHGELVQYHCSDWDFIVARAEAMGMLVLVEDGAIRIAPPVVQGQPVLTLTWGHNLIDLSADIDARSQWTSVQAAAWDPAQLQNLMSSPARPERLNAQGNLDGRTLARVASPDIYSLQSSAAQPKDVLDAWAKGMQMRAGLARFGPGPSRQADPARRGGRPFQGRCFRQRCAP